MGLTSWVRGGLDWIEKVAEPVEEIAETVASVAGALAPEKGGKGSVTITTGPDGGRQVSTTETPAPPGPGDGILSGKMNLGGFQVPTVALVVAAAALVFFRVKF